MKLKEEYIWLRIIFSIIFTILLIFPQNLLANLFHEPNQIFVNESSYNHNTDDQVDVLETDTDPWIESDDPSLSIPHIASQDHDSRASVRKTEFCWPMLRNTIDRLGVSSSGIPSTGAILWSNTVDLSYASPVAAYNRVYITTNRGYIACYQETTGNLCWKTQLSVKTNNSAVSTPAVNSGFIITFCSGDGTLYKLDAYTGEINWTYTLPGKDTTINVANIDYPILIHKGLVLFGAPNKYFYCLNVTTGNLVWRFKTQQGLTYNYGVTSGAAANGDSIYFGANDGYLYAMDLDGFLDSMNDGPWQLEGANTTIIDGDVLWKFFTGDSICSTPAVINNYVYVTVGIHDSSFSNYDIFKIFCIDRNTGLWVWDYQTGNHLVSSPAIEGDKVIFGSLDGNVYCLTTTSNTSQWTPFTTTGEVWSSPAVSIAGMGGKLVVGDTDGKLYCIYTHNGQSYWQRVLDGSITSSPALANNRVFVNTRQGTLYCLGAADNQLPLIINTIPLHNEANIPVSKNILIKFDEPITKSSISNKSIILTRSDSQQVPIELDYSEETWTVTIKPKVYLNISTDYTVTVRPGVTDWAGNPLDGNRDGNSDGSPDDDYKWSFTTSNNHPPQLTNAMVSPTSGKLGTNFKFTVLYTDIDNPPKGKPPNEILIYFDDGTKGSMTRDTNRQIPGPYRDINYTNGEQYIFTKQFKTQGIHGFRIWCSDGIDWNETSVLNQPVVPGPPVIKTILDQVVLEDEELILNLSEYVSDPDTPLDNLSVIVNSDYAQVNGLVISFIYPNSFNYPSGRVDEIVNISVSDLEFSTQTVFRVWVTPVNDPPIIKPIPQKIVVEKQEEDLNLSEYIFDVDNTLDELNVTEDSENANIDNTKKELFLNYPVGGQNDKILLNVTDGELWTEKTFEVKVVSSDESFVLREIDDINVIEDIEYSLSLVDEIFIIDNNVSPENLSVKCTSEYSNVDGFDIKFLYSDTFTYKSKSKFEIVKIIVTDIVANYSQSTDLRVNVTSINDAPVLNNETVDPEYGNITNEFTFTVFYYDIDGSDNIKVNLILDGKEFAMTKIPGDKSKYPGSKYNISMTMGIGYHYYYFACDDGSGGPNCKFSTRMAKLYVTGNLGAQLIPGSEINQTDTDGDGKPDVSDTDDDNDGIPDTWEELYGLDRKNHSDAFADFDGDDFINLLEYWGHDGRPGGNDSTNPNNPLDKPESPVDTSDKTGITLNTLLYHFVLIIIILIIIIFIYNMIIGRGLPKVVKLSARGKSKKKSETEADLARVEPEDSDVVEVVEIEGDESEEDYESLDEDEDIEEFDFEAEAEAQVPGNEVPVMVVDLTMDDQPFLESDLETEEEEPEIEPIADEDEEIDDIDAITEAEPIPLERNKQKTKKATKGKSKTRKAPKSKSK